jgi:NADPH:quinone reductase-like Zn-dependent oxidoreductase/acyl carrier protein
MGLYPGITDTIVPIGIECSGVVSRVGPGVDRFKPGDAVMGVAPYSFASHTTTTDYALVPKPDTLDHEEASTVPITFMTAYYGLRRLADIQSGERVLIHAGAGGVGLAAIQIAQQAGAEIFATAGSDEKREFLHALGVPHVMNSRSLDFADEILELTDREGVDIVLNSLPGDAIAKSLSVLRAYGRFLEIGKTDIYRNSMIGLAPFQDNLSYFAIDLDRMLRQRPEYIQTLFSEVMQHFESGDYIALPLTRFSADQTVDAFRYMAQRKNIGKVVVAMNDCSQSDKAETRKSVEIDSEAAYLITGGLGALGLRVAQWLADQGARNIVLMSRSKPVGDAADQLTTWNAEGIRAVAVQGDVADRHSLADALKQIPGEFPSLRGIIHAAGVLADGVMFDMDLDQLDKPLRPKVQGAWNLHTATIDHPLDFFVLFSSVACVLGSPGQANYAAANAFLDSLAAHRKSHGLPALSINWGPWADSGMAAEAGRDEQLSARGMSLLPADKALEALEMLINGDQSNVAVMSVNWSNLLRASGGRAVPPLLSKIAANIDVGAGADSAEDQAFRAELATVDIEKRKEILNGYFCTQLAAIMGLEAEDIDVTQPLNTLGLDSLMVVELKNKIENKLRITLPMALFMKEPSVSDLSHHVAGTYDNEATTDANSS